MTHTALLRISWPDKALSKNAGSPWSKGTQIRRSKAVAAQRREVWALALEQGVKRLRGPLRLSFTFHPPDRRRRDVQNVPEMLAGAIDGIADAHGTDDWKYKPDWPDHFSEPVKGGCVLIEVRGAGE